MNLYPLALRLDGRRVLVVGGGAVATRRMPALLAAGAEVEVVSPELTPALHAFAADGRITWTGRRFQPSDVDGVWLVQVAVDDPAAATSVSAAAEERRVFCVRADDRDAATAWTPAVTRHGEITVAVTDSGDRRRAMAVRDLVSGALEATPRSKTAVDVLKVDRIDHGYTAIDNPAFAARCAEAGIVFTVVPTNSYYLRTLAPERWALDHPIRRMPELGLRIHPNTDDPTLHHVTPTGAWTMMARDFGFGLDQLRAFMLNGLDAAWIDESTRRRWREQAMERFDSLRGRLIASPGAAP